MVYFVLIAIIGSYYLSSLLKDKEFFKVNLLWAASIILLSFKFGDFGIISPEQILILIFIFLVNFIFVNKISQKFKLQTNKFMIFSAVILAPILEESFFRGWLLPSIPGTDLQKIAISSVLFGLYHIKNYQLMEGKALIYQILYAAFIMGPILGFARIESGSIFLPVILHSLNNMIASTMTKLLFPVLVRYKKGTGYN